MVLYKKGKGRAAHLPGDQHPEQEEYHLIPRVSIA